MNKRFLLLLCMAAWPGLATNPAQAADEDIFLGQIRTPSEQTLGHDRSALWTLPLVAVQYQPQKTTPAIQKALQAQNDGRFLDALIALDEGKGQVDAQTQAEMDLLRASFLLQGGQFQQARQLLEPLRGKAQFAADASALLAMMYLQQGDMQQALPAAQRAHETDVGALPHLALSYTQQGEGKLIEARDTMRGFNARTPQALTLAREAELELTLSHAQTARKLVEQAQALDAANPYVAAVNGLVLLIEERPAQAKNAFESTLRRDPQDPKALLGLGLANIRLGEMQEGLKKLQAADEADPRNALILTYLGRAQQQAGQDAAARQSWRAAQQADPKDPTPWLYQAQAELRANRLQDARDSLHEAQSRTGNRSVYRSERLLQEDEQLLRANLAEIQRRMGLDALAFHALSDVPGEQSSTALRNQADLLQGQRFGESARRSLLLQSLFDEQPGSLPSELDIYGDGAGLTGAQAPQHGAVSVLNAQQASYNNYDSLFMRRTTLAADATTGNQGTLGGQVRAGAGSDTLGVSMAARNYKTDGTGVIPNLMDNRIMHGVVQWRPSQSTQIFAAYQTFHSLHGEIAFPWDPINQGYYHLLEDNSSILRLGWRQALSGDSELRSLFSRQKTDLTDQNGYISFMPPYSTSGLPGMGPTLPFPQSTLYASSEASSMELQYRVKGTASATQWGAHLYHGPSLYNTLNNTSDTKQIYAARQQKLGAHWLLDAHLAWQDMSVRDNLSTTIYTSHRRWLPQIGLAYSPDEATHLRLAAWREIGGDTVGDATLAPATLAGIMMKRPGERNNLVDSIALQADRQLETAWLLEGQAQHRFATYVPHDFSLGLDARKQTDEGRLALHWQPANRPWAVSLASDYEYFHVPGAFDNLSIANSWNSVETQRLLSQQVDMRWFASAGLTLQLAWSHNLVSADMQSYDIAFNPILVPYQESFNQTDVSLDWQFGKQGTLALGVRNATDRRFQYTSLDPLNPRFSAARLTYARLRIAW